MSREQFVLRLTPNNPMDGAALYVFVGSIRALWGRLGPSGGSYVVYGDGEDMIACVKESPEDIIRMGANRGVLIVLN